MATAHIELKLLAVAQAELCRQDLKLSDRISALFADSLEYISFIAALKDLGELSDEAIAKAETLGELADAIVPAN